MGLGLGLGLAKPCGVGLKPRCQQHQHRDSLAGQEKKGAGKPLSVTLACLCSADGGSCWLVATAVRWDVAHPITRFQGDSRGA